MLAESSTPVKFFPWFNPTAMRAVGEEHVWLGEEAVAPGEPVPLGGVSVWLGEEAVPPEEESVLSEEKLVLPEEESDPEAAGFAEACANRFLKACQSASWLTKYAGQFL